MDTETIWAGGQLAKHGRIRVTGDRPGCGKVTVRLSDELEARRWIGATGEGELVDGTGACWVRVKTKVSVLRLLRKLEPVLDVEQLDPMRMIAGVPEEMVQRPRIGQPVVLPS